MKLKLNKDGSAVVRDGKPVYVLANGKEEAFDAAGAVNALGRRYFETSTFAQSKLSIPADVALAAFGDAFKLENGRLVAFSAAGSKLYSKTRFGEVANFDEALEQLVDQYPEKEMILRRGGSQAPVPAGPTSGPAAGGTGAGGKVVTRAQFDAMPHLKRAPFMREGGQVID